MANTHLPSATISFFFAFFTLLSLTSALSLPSNIYTRQAPTLKTGSWLITYQPTAANSPLYKGPFRVTSKDGSTFISGDLYNGTAPVNPSDGSPILPRTNYWSFIRTTKLASGANGGFSLGLEYYGFQGFIKRPQTNESKWENEPKNGGYTVDLTPKLAPVGYPDSANYFEGDVKIASSGTTVGKFTMGWVNQYVRRIKVEIGTAPGLEVPLKDTSGTRDWKAIFHDAGYEVDVVVGKTDIPEPSSDGYWTNEQEHAAVLQYRKPTDFDKEWKYYLLVVRHMREVQRGAMIDSGGEYNGVPREGTCISTEWPVGTNADGTQDTRHAWPESVRGKKFVELHDAWYRTAVHEVGHMFNLEHPPGFFGDIMTDTDTYVDAGENGESAKRFPENITPESFTFLEDHKFHMQHRPDVHVRPGFADYGWAVQSNTPPVVPNL